MTYTRHSSIDFPGIRQYEKFSCAGRKKKSFWDHVGDRSAFMKLNRPEKERIFLRWKYGTSNDSVNAECEMTDGYLCNRVREFGIDGMDEGLKEFWNNELAFHQKCLAIKQEIGLSNTPLQVTLKDIKTTSRADWEE